MEPNSQVDPIEVMEAQIRESFARVLWSHKTHEKQADIYFSQLSTFRTLQIVLSAVTTSGIIVALAGNTPVGTIVSGISSTFLLGINLFFKNYDMGKLVQRHIDTASDLLEIREEYITLIADIRAGLITEEEIRERRNALSQRSLKIFSNAPRTTSKAYERATVALKKNEEFTLRDDEIDKFLPSELRKNQ